MDGQARLGGREQLQGHVELRRTEVSEALRSAHLGHLRGDESRIIKWTDIEHTALINPIPQSNLNHVIILHRDQVNV